MNLQKKLFDKRQIKDFLMINLGVFLMAIAYSVFIDPNNLVIGGVGGIATLLKDILAHITIFGMHITSSFIILIFNVILLVFAFVFIGKSFFLKTLYASLIYPVYIFILELVIHLLGDKFINLTLIANHLQQQTNLDSTTIKVIMAGSYLVFVIFGAVISGIGLGLALKRGASTGGVDIIQQIFLKYFKIPFSVSLIIIDGAIVLSASFYFQDLSPARVRLPRDASLLDADRRQLLRDLPCQAALRRPWQELPEPRAGRPCRARRVLHEPDDLLDRPGLRQGTALRRR